MAVTALLGEWVVGVWVWVGVGELGVEVEVDHDDDDPGGRRGGYVCSKAQGV